MVYVSPIKHFGRGWAETSQSSLLVTVESEGLYNVLVIALRIDKDAIDEFAEFGVEHVHDPELSKCWELLNTTQGGIHLRASLHSVQPVQPPQPSIAYRV